MSTDTFYLKPARPDMVVRDPTTGKPLPAEGAWKPRSSHWHRRMREGSVIEAAPFVAKAKKE